MTVKDGEGNALGGGGMYKLPDLCHNKKFDPELVGVKNGSTKEKIYAYVPTEGRS